MGDRQQSEQGGRPAGGRVLLEAVGVGLVFLVLYAVTLSDNLSIAHDSIHYAQKIEDGRNPFHPHHLLYVPTARLWVQECVAAGLDIDRVQLIELLNAFFGAGTLAMVFLAMRRGLAMARTRAAIACGIIGTSFGFWYYSVCIEVYLIPAFFLVAAFCLAVMGRPTLANAFATSVAWALAVLFHQTNVLLAPVLLVAYLSRREHAIGRRWGRFLLCASTATVLVLAVYAGVMVFSLQLKSWPEAWGWMTDYAHRSQWGHFTWSMIPNAIVGFGRCFIGGHFGVSGAMTEGLFGGILEGHMLEDERFLVRGLSAWGAAVLVALTLLAAMAAAMALLRNARSRTGGERPREQIVCVRVAAVWFCVYAAFFTWWEPTNSEFWIVPLIALVLAVWSWIERSQRGWRCWAVAAMLLFAINLTGSIRFLWSQDNDMYFQRTRWYAENVATGELIVAGHRWIWGDYLEYFTPADVWCISERGSGSEAFGELAATIQRRRQAGHRIWISEDAAHPSAETLSDAAAIEAFWSRFASEWVPIEVNGRRVYAISPGHASHSGKRTAHRDDSGN